MIRVSTSRHSCWSLGSWPVDRIAIVGCGGSGKSRLARSLGDTLVHLDGLYETGRNRGRSGSVD